MPDPLSDFPTATLDDYLPDSAPDDLVITASNRLAREIRGRFADHARSGAALLPDVVPFGPWLRSCWQKLRFQALLSGDEHIGGATLLTEWQESLLWENVLREGGAGDRLLFLDETVEACIRSAALGEQHHIPWDDAAWDRDEECLVFRRWYRALRTECQSRKWVLPGRLPGYLARNLTLLRDALSRRIFLAGFEETTPAQEALFQALGGVALSMRVLAPRYGETAVAVEVRSAVDAVEEIRAAAQWVARRLEENREQRIAVVLPDLASRRVEAEEIFLRELHPGWERLPGAARESSFDLTLGQPLSENAVARAGLELVGLLRGDSVLRGARYLLRCPYFARESRERGARARLESRLLRQRRSLLPLQALRQESLLVEELSGESLAGWKAALLALERFELSGEQPPSAWANRVRALWLECLWLGEPALNSAEFQARHRALEELGAMAELDAISSRMGFPAFVRQLRKRFEGATFQPESNPKPVLVAGLFEVTGLRFDAAWVCGLNDNVLPRVAQPDPFLPRFLQREKNLPGSSPAREIAFGRRSFDRLLSLAPRLVLSYPLRAEQEELEPSPYLRALSVDGRIPVLPADAGSAWPALPEPVVEMIADWRATALPAERARASRGAQVLADQSDCPFRAFARTRLSSEAEEQETALMNRMDQGSFVHKAMEIFWRQTSTHDALLRMGDEEANERIRASVDAALTGFIVEAGNALAAAQRDAERIRIAELMSRWIDQERVRKPFRVVGVEQDRSAEIGGLGLRIRPDRIDELDDGSFALIDYKTGSVNTNMWEGERPEQPQLLLYLAAELRPVTAIAFASLKVGKPAWMAYADRTDDRFIPTKKPALPQGEWDGFVSRSQATVENLSRQFREGHAPVDPATGRDACAYCEQAPLCRIAESRQGAGDADGERGEE